MADFRAWPPRSMIGFKPEGLSNPAQRAMFPGPALDLPMGTSQELGLWGGADDNSRLQLFVRPDGVVAVEELREDIQAQVRNFRFTAISKGVAQVEARDAKNALYCSMSVTVFETVNPDETMIDDVGVDAPCRQKNEYIDNVIDGSFDIYSRQFFIQHAIGKRIELNFIKLLSDVRSSSPQLPTYFISQADGLIRPRVFSKLVTPNIASMVLDTEAARISAELMSQIASPILDIVAVRAQTSSIFEPLPRGAPRKAATFKAIGKVKIPKGLLSKGAKPPNMKEMVDPFTGEVLGVSATAGTKRSLRTAIDASGAEFESFKQALFERGEIGIQSPGGANVPGVDFITAQRRADGMMEVLLNDATVNGRKIAKTSPPATWVTEAEAAVAPGRLDLGNPALEREIQVAMANGRVRVRTLQVNLSPQGVVNVSGW